MSDNPPITLSEPLARALTRIANHAHTAQLAAVEATAVVNDTRETRRALAGELMEKALDQCGDVLNGLAMLGVRPPALERKNVGPLDLSQLANMDTPNARKLLILLEEASILAEALDLERGQVVPAEWVGPGEGRGTNWGESLTFSVWRLRDEINGPPGRE